MKAILEIDAPETCAECILCDLSRFSVCMISDVKSIEEAARIRLSGWKYNISRAPFCPLKIVEESEGGENE